MARFTLLPTRKDGEPLEAWGRHVRKRARMLQAAAALIFIGVIVIEFQQKWSASPGWLFGVVFVLVLILVSSDYMTSRAERDQYDAEWALYDEQDRQAKRKVEDV